MYYHASPHRFKPGDLVSHDHYVFMSDRPAPHFTIAEQAMKEGWDVYEVLPTGRVWPGMWHDFIANSAEVIRRVGSARGLGRKGPSRPPCCHRKASGYRQW